MRVLIAGQAFTTVGGVQSDERELGAWLIERGHSVVVYSPVLGDGTYGRERGTIALTDDLDTIGTAPDIIHGDNALSTITALLHFTNTPAVFVCHAWAGAAAMPPRFPRIYRYIAVDDTCADRLRFCEGFSDDAIHVLLNGFDTARFELRGPLPPKPLRAVAFGNMAHELTFLPAVREACRRAGMELDVLGRLAGTAVTDPESVLGRYDLAFAKGKCAIEAMASGLAVVLCDIPGMGEIVRTTELDRLRRLNFGRRALSRPVTVELLLNEIARYDAADARAVAIRIREFAASDLMHEALFEHYEAVVKEHDADGERQQQWEAESRAAAAFLRRHTQMNAQPDAQYGAAWNAAQKLMTAPLIGPAVRHAVRVLARRK